MVQTATPGIGLLGSTALLVSSITGPGLTTISLMFQQSGWVLPTVVFILMAFLSGCSALFICEAMSNIRGNERFQAKVEFTTIAQLYLGKHYHLALQVLLYLAMQSVNIASIVISVQTLDDMFIALFKRTCGVGFSPAGWICVTEQTANNSPFPSGSYFFFTFGFLATAVLVVPLGFFNLVENVKVQVGSFILLIGILTEWVISFGIHGLDPSMVPATSNNSSQVVGTVLLNYAFITTIPSWVNEVRRDVSVHTCIWLSLCISCFFYILIGITGAMSYSMNGSSNILDYLRTDGSMASKVAVYMFPLVALVTSVPVFTIVIRSNLLRGRVCNKYLAHFLASGAPWFIVMLLQTSDWLNMFLNWTSLFLQSTVNFVLPFALYFISKRYEAKIEDPPQHDSAVDHDTFVMYNPEENRSISIQRTPSTHITNHSKVGQPADLDVPTFSLDEKAIDISTQQPVIPDIILTDTNNSDHQSLIYTSNIVEGNFLQIPSNIPYANNSSESTKILSKDLGSQESDKHQTFFHSSNTASLDHKENQEESTHEEYVPQTRSRGPSVTLSIETGYTSSHIRSRRRSGSMSPTQSLAIITIDPNSPSSLRTTSFLSASAPHTNPFPMFRDVQLSGRFQAFPSLGSVKSFLLAILAFTLITLAVVFTIIYDFVLLGEGINVYES
ncbi:hypothetical protein INT44_005544 [Umbelopsis vinacea]|uniref:Amino acid transporter transmembrane domain-containing protein n=1 Tax=Umbelopsis vinacea TaxID=44442 RepID=A0A8H7PE07_9FUNG|nr:hypothetical protein INT44_005544 [Umbelopsis vinacea]